MCKIRYDSVTDVLQVLENKYKSSEVDFYKLGRDLPLYVIGRKDRVIGLEFIGFKDFVKNFYKANRKDFDFKKYSDAEEFMRGSLYNMFKFEFVNGKLSEVKREIKIQAPPIEIKKSIKELIAV